MRYRKVEPKSITVNGREIPNPHYGDMIAVHFQGQIDTGADAVMDAVHSRLRLLYSEWWENTALGFAIPNFLMLQSRTPRGIKLLANYITAYILDTENVTAVSDVDAWLDDRRRMHYTCRIHTPFGILEGGIDEDVILRAVS